MVPICKTSFPTIFSEVKQHWKPIIFSSRGIYPNNNNNNKVIWLPWNKEKLGNHLRTQETDDQLKIPSRYQTTTTSFFNLLFLFLMPEKLLQMSHWFPPIF